MAVNSNRSSYSGDSSSTLPTSQLISSTRFLTGLHRILYSPFFTDMASGELDVELFGEFTTQQRYLLESLALAFDSLVNPNKKGLVSGTMGTLLKNQSRLKNEIEQQMTLSMVWGVCCLPMADALPSTLRFKDFIMSNVIHMNEASGRNVSELTYCAALAIMAATFDLYVCLGKRMKEYIDLSGKDNLYRHWIGYYASKRYEVAVSVFRVLLEDVLSKVDGYTRLGIKLHYGLAMDHLEDVFVVDRNYSRIRPAIREKPGKILICSNFSSCTDKDFLGVWRDLLINKSGSSALLAWEHIAQQYIRGYEDCVASNFCNQKLISNLLSFEQSVFPEGEQILVDSGLIKTLVELGIAEKSDMAETVFDYQGLFRAIQNISAFQKRSVTQVFCSQFSQGFSREVIEKAGKTVSLHEGCSEFFKRCCIKDIEIQVLSCSFLGDLIQPSLKSAGLTSVKVYSNQLVFEDSVTSGHMVGKMHSAEEMLFTFNKITAKYISRLIVFIGNCVEDLLPLINADIGIYVGKPMKEAGNTFGITFMPLYDSVVDKGGSWVSVLKSADIGIIYYVSTWMELSAFFSWYLQEL